MLSSYRDYLIIVFGILFSLLTAILAVALTNIIEIYSENHLIIIIIFCSVAIIILIKLFKRIIGLKFSEKTLNVSNLDTIQIRFEKEIIRIHSDVQKSFHICTVKDTIIFNLIFIIPIMLYCVIIFIITFFLMYIFIKFQDLIKFYQLPNEMRLIIFIGFLLILFYKSSSILIKIYESLVKHFKHTIEYIWNCGLFILNPEECHVIFNSNNDTVVIKFLSEEEYLYIEKMIRNLDIEYTDDTSIPICE